MDYGEVQAKAMTLCQACDEAEGTIPCWGQASGIEHFCPTCAAWMREKEGASLCYSCGILIWDGGNWGNAMFPERYCGAPACLEAMQKEDTR
jgi:hypothetical protein